MKPAPETADCESNVIAVIRILPCFLSGSQAEAYSPNALAGPLRGII